MSQSIADKIAENNDEGQVVTTGADDGPAMAADIRTKEAARAHGGLQKYQKNPYQERRTSKDGGRASTPDKLALER